MTVGQLMKALNKFDQDLPVCTGFGMNSEITGKIEEKTNVEYYDEDFCVVHPDNENPVKIVVIG